MTCPNCGQHSYCGCRHCAPKNKGKVIEIWLDEEIGITACGHCGFAMSVDIWSAMEADMFMPEFKKEDGVYVLDENGRHVEIPDSGMSLEDASAKYLPEGRMPGDTNYKPSFRVHWTVKLWRWRAILKHMFQMLLGQSKPYRGGSKWLTFKDQMAKF